MQQMHNGRRNNGSNGKSALNKPTPVVRKAFQGRDVKPGEVAALILDDLSHTYSNLCNFYPEAQLCREGELYLASLALAQKLEPMRPHTALEAWVKAQALACVKKVVDPQYDRWPDTIRQWRQHEHRCHRFSQYFIAWNKRQRSDRPRLAEMDRFVEFLHYVLGEAPDMDAILQRAHHGPGSTVGVSGESVHYVAKLGKLDCTPYAAELAARSLVHDKALWSVLGHDPQYAYLDSAREGFERDVATAIASEYVDHDILLFIHKSLTALRSIGKQPTLNVMLQLGVDDEIKNLLLYKAGVNLRSQAKNQKLAYQGSYYSGSDDPYCTTDLTDASNLICSALVLFMPVAWAKLLWRLRTPKYEAPPEMGGGIHEYQLYAGMGNGTTFSVESLIFTAALYATSFSSDPQSFCREAEFSVFGDDIVARRSHTLRLLPFLEFLGLKVNRSKSFTEGPFRESCGADYWDGTNIRPAYVKCETSSMSETDLMGVHNTLADNPNFHLIKAMAGIRALYSECVSPVVPTDWSGNLGFRPVGCAHYTLVTSRDGKVLVSPVWHRPRVYKYSVKAKLDALEQIGPWTQLAVALIQGKQDLADSVQDGWALPYRKLVSMRLVPERDMERPDLLTMLRNQLSRLSQRKSQPWWNDYQGVDSSK